MKKGSRGRPLKQPEERKSDRIIFRLEAEERATIEQAAILANVKLSEWIRTRLTTAARREIKRAQG